MTKIDFKTLRRSFDEEILSIRHFNSSVGKLVTKGDQESQAILRKEFELLLGLDQLKDSATDIAKGSTHGSVPSGRGEEIEEIFSKALGIFFSQEGQTKLVEFALQHSNKFFEYEPILRRGILTVLISALDNLFASLVRLYYEAHPDALLAIEKQLDLRTIRKIGSIEGIEDFIIDDRVQHFLYMSLDEKLRHLRKQTGVNLMPLQYLRADIVEIVLRRNLAVHGNSTVNQYHIDKITELHLDPSLLTIKIGDRLPLDAAYLDKSIARIQLFGIILMTQCVLQWRPSLREEVYDYLSRHMYWNTFNSNFEDLLELAFYIRNICRIDDSISDLALVSQATALHELERREELAQLTADLELWSSSIYMSLFHSALCDDSSKFFSILPEAITKSAIKLPELLTHPLFSSYRGKQEFQEILQRNVRGT